MDITKLLAILESNSLFFPSIVNLDDPLEGFLNRATVNKFRKIPENLSQDEEEKTKMTIERNLQILKDARRLLNVSSWHMNEHESAAMWQLYLESNEGIAIQSTYKRLKESFKNAEEEVHVGMVKYIDEDNDTIDWTNVINYAVHKRKSFEHEKELRAVVLSPSNNGGVSVTIDLETLIQKIYIAPNSPRWIYELIQKVIKRYGFNERLVEKSKMYESPLY